MRNYEQYPVWKAAHALALDVYRLTNSFPDEERFGLVSQLRRSVSSIPSNIAEGSRRRSEREFRRFLDIASGSANEVEYQLRLTRDLGYLDDNDVEAARGEVRRIRRMLTGLIRHIDNP